MANSERYRLYPCPGTVEGEGFGHAVWVEYTNATSGMPEEIRDLGWRAVGAALEATVGDAPTTTESPAGYCPAHVVEGARMGTVYAEASMLATY